MRSVEEMLSGARARARLISQQDLLAVQEIGLLQSRLIARQALANLHRDQAEIDDLMTDIEGVIRGDISGSDRRTE